MRHVFSNMYEVAHLWAHQTQEDGRSSNFFFDSNKIYSYGYHFMVGKIVTNPKGEKAYILNSESYSSSTCKHQCAAEAAIPSGSLVFRVPGCESPELNYYQTGMHSFADAMKGVIYYLNVIETFMVKHYRARKLSYVSEISMYIDKLCKWVEFFGVDKDTKWYKGQFGGDAKKYPTIRKMLTSKNAVEKIRKEFCGSMFDLELVVKAVQVYRFLSDRDMCAGMNGNEMEDMVVEFINSDETKERIEVIQKERRAERKRRAEEVKKRAAAMLKLDQENLDEWHRKERDRWWPREEWQEAFGWHTALRLSHSLSCIETSKGIKISLEEAKRLWIIVKRFHENGTFTHQIANDMNGSKWAFNSYENDVLTAGCHKISYSEMERIAKQLNWI